MQSYALIFHLICIMRTLSLFSFVHTFCTKRSQYDTWEAGEGVCEYVFLPNYPISISMHQTFKNLPAL